MPSDTASGRTSVAAMGLLDGRVALVTGSTRGIGLAIAERYGAEGARVVVNGRSAADAERVAATIPGAIGIGGDLSKLDDVNRLVEQVAAALGPIEILVNNAAISRRSAITRVTDEEWDEVLAVNLTGPFYVSRAVIPAMKTLGRGVIINMTSGAGTHGVVGFTSYSASKAGIVGLTYTWAKELAAFGIRVNAMSPAALTDMMRELPDELLDPMLATLPDPVQVADVALFLASDHSAVINGQVVDATGAA